jgi:DNA-directed RNA polymerase subunit RPC12/RpoP
MYCHACSKNFVAELDYSMSGNHQVECPHCGHLHFRQIKDGRVTGERWGSDPNTHIVRRGSVWKSDSQPMVTSTASAFIRDRWVNRSDQG